MTFALGPSYFVTSTFHCPLVASRSARVTEKGLCRNTEKSHNLTRVVNWQSAALLGLIDYVWFNLLPRSLCCLIRDGFGILTNLPV